MKKMIVLVGLLLSVLVTEASEIIKMPMQDFNVTPNMDYVYEIKTTKFDKVILDCQSFITGMSFTNSGSLKSNVYLDMFMCEEMVNFLIDSKKENLPVCIGLDDENHELVITREEGVACN
jgi:hypothetical protein